MVFALAGDSTTTRVLRGMAGDLPLSGPADPCEPAGLRRGDGTTGHRAGSRLQVAEPRGRSPLEPARTRWYASVLFPGAERTASCRLLALFTDTVTEALAEYGYLAIFVLMLLESACIPIPSEVTMLFGGALASAAFAGAGNELDAGGWSSLAGTLGNLVGSWLAYWAGDSAAGR